MPLFETILTEKQRATRCQECGGSVSVSVAFARRNLFDLGTGELIEEGTEYEHDSWDDEYQCRNCGADVLIEDDDEAGHP